MKRLIIGISCLAFVSTSAMCLQNVSLPNVLSNTMLVNASTTSQYEGTYGELTYFNWGDYISITGCSTSVTSVTIPSTIDGFSVLGIDKEAFKDCTELVSISLPTCLEYISYYAFSGCTSLTSIVIPDSVKRINQQVFIDCTSLTDVTIGGGITSWGDKPYNNLFKNCTSLTNVIIKEGVTSIPDEIFSECTSLTSITIPSTIKSIGTDAFANCINLENLYISDIVSWCAISFANGERSNPMYGNLYLNGELVTDLVIPDGVSEINDYAFLNCRSLESVTIPDSVTTIGEKAFGKCTNLQSINLGNGVTTIGSDAFYVCNSLKSIDIPSSVTTIGDEAFEFSSSLETVNIPDSVTTIGDNAFYQCSSLKTIDIPNSVTDIGKQAFYKCYDLQSATLGSGVLTIGDKAFSECISLEYFEVDEDNPNYISQDGVLFDKDLETLICYPTAKPTELYCVPSSVTTIKDYAFNTNTTASIVVPDNVINISDNFIECHDKTSPWYNYDSSFKIIVYTSMNSPTHQVLNERVKYNMVCYEKSGSEVTIVCCANGKDINLVIPSEIEGLPVTTIGKGISLRGYVYESTGTSTSTKYYNFSYKSIVIPEGVTTISKSAFSQYDIFRNYKLLLSSGYITTLSSFNPTLESVTIPSTVTEIGDYAFDCCINLTTINLSSENKSFSIIDGVLFTADKTELVWYQSNALSTSYTIPSGVTTIGKDAFCFAVNLDTIYIPRDVKYIQEYAFDNCTALTDIYYAGTEDEWNAIIKSSNNSVLDDVTIHYGESISQEKPTHVDVLTLKKYVMGISNSSSENLDYNEDGYINILDVTYLKNLLLLD